MDANKVALACSAAVAVASVVPMPSNVRTAVRVTSMLVSLARSAAQVVEMRRRIAWLSRGHRKYLDKRPMAYAPRESNLQACIKTVSRCPTR